MLSDAGTTWYHSTTTTTMYSLFYHLVVSPFLYRYMVGCPSRAKTTTTAKLGSLHESCSLTPTLPSPCLLAPLLPPFLCIQQVSINSASPCGLPIKQRASVIPPHIPYRERLIKQYDRQIVSTQRTSAQRAKCTLKQTRAAILKGKGRPGSVVLAYTYFLPPMVGDFESLSP